MKHIKTSLVAAVLFIAAAPAMDQKKLYSSAYFNKLYKNYHGLACEHPEFKAIDQKVKQNDVNYLTMLETSKEDNMHMFESAHKIFEEFEKKSDTSNYFASIMKPVAYVGKFFSPYYWLGSSNTEQPEIVLLEDQKSKDWWDKPFRTPRDKEHGMGYSVAGKGYHYVVAWYFQLAPARVYNALTGKLEFIHKLQPGENIHYVQASRDGLCYCVHVLKDGEFTTYLYSLKGDVTKPVVIPQGVRFIGDEGGTAYALAVKESHLECYNVVEGTMKKLEIEGTIKRFDTLSGKTYAVVLNDKNKTFIFNIKTGERSEIADTTWFEYPPSVTADHIFTALSGGKLCIWDVSQSVKPYFAKEYHGDGEIKNGSWIGSKDEATLLLKTANKIHIYRLKEGTEACIDDIQNDWQFFSKDFLGIKIPNTHQFVYYATKDGKEVGRVQFEARNWSAVQYKHWHILNSADKDDAENLLYDAKNNKEFRDITTGYMGWSIADMNSSVAFAHRCKDKSKARVHWSQDDDIKTTDISSRDGSDFVADVSGLDKHGKLFAGVTGKAVYFYDAQKGELLAQIDHDSKDPCVDVSFREQGDYCALFCKKSIKIVRIKDQKFEVVKTIDLGAEEFFRGHFYSDGYVLFVVTSKNLLYYSIQNGEFVEIEKIEQKK